MRTIFYTVSRFQYTMPSDPMFCFLWQAKLYQKCLGLGSYIIRENMINDDPSVTDRVMALLYKLRITVEQFGLILSTLWSRYARK